jgi:hypothetical protein
MECRTRGFTPRLFSAALTLVLASGPARSQGILPPDAAARAFDEGREAVRKGRFADGLRLLQQALATGHTQPREQLGTTRGFVDRYDPHYWIGVAYMETGDDVRARESLLRSRAGGLVDRWPEGRDLADRLTRLDQREAARRPKPAEPVLVPPTPTRPPEAAVSIPAEGFTSSGATPVPDRQRTPESPATGPPERLVVPAAPADLAELAPALQALETASWGDADRALARFRERAPGVPLADLVDAVAKGSRYLLEGRADASLLVEARRLLQSYRKRGGARKAEETLISPALASVLSY